MVEHPAGEANQVALNAVGAWMRAGINNGAIGTNTSVKEIVVWWLLDEAYDSFLGDTRLGPSFVVEYHKPIVGIVIHELNAVRFLPE